MANTNTQLAIKPVLFEVAGEKVELAPETVKNYLVRGNGEVTNQEVLMFMNLCQYQKLNPFINEAYLIKFGNAPAQIVVSKEAFMKRAEQHEEFNGFEAGIVYEIDGELKEVTGAIKPRNAELVGGWCKVYRNDREKPIEVKVSFDEFNKKQSTWKDQPMNMIRKVAIVNALREAFPQTLGSMYTEDEGNKATDDIPEYKPRKDITQQANVIDMEPVQQQETDNSEESQIKKIRKEIAAKFRTLGIPKSEQKAYMEQHVPNFKGTLADYVGLSELLDMHIDMQSVPDMSDDELPFSDEDTLE